jgi:hypothetical protein
MRTAIVYVLLALLIPLQPMRAGTTLYASRQRHSVKAGSMPLPLQRVAFCESRHRHYDRHGKVLRGRKNRNNIGLYQINRLWHERRATQLGYNIWSLHGNTGYALRLYREHGLAPWTATARCQRDLARRGVVPPR